MSIVTDAEILDFVGISEISFTVNATCDVLVMKYDDNPNPYGWIVYRSTNMNNGKSYIGQTKNSLFHRKRQHEYTAKHHRYKRHPFYDAINHYGSDAFEWCILCECFSEEDTNKMETFCIQTFQSHYLNNGYNITLGGHGMRGYRYSEEQKRKMSENRKGKNIGYRHTEETKIKVGNANRGRTPSLETRKKLSIAGTGRVHSEETKAKMSTSQIGKKNHRYGTKHSEDDKINLSNKLKGRTFSEEHKSKIAAANRRRWSPTGDLRLMNRVRDENGKFIKEIKNVDC